MISWHSNKRESECVCVPVSSRSTVLKLSSYLLFTADSFIRGWFKVSQMLYLRVRQSIYVLPRYCILFLETLLKKDELVKILCTVHVGFLILLLPNLHF